MRNVLTGAILGGILGAVATASIAAVTPGTWTNTEAGVIGFWLGVGLGAFFGVLGSV